MAKVKQFRKLREIPELEIREEIDETTTDVTKFFHVSQETMEAFGDGSVAVIPARVNEDTGISVSALEEYKGRISKWNGWAWLHDEMIEVGLVPLEYGLGR